MTLACHAPGPDCFCVCCDGGPWLTSGFDIQFSDLGDAPPGRRGHAARVRRPSPPARPRLFAPAAAGRPRRRDARRSRRSIARSRGARTWRTGSSAISLDRVPQEKWDAVGRGLPGLRRLLLRLPDLLVLHRQRPSRSAPRRFERERALGCLPLRGVHAGGVGPQPARPRRPTGSSGASSTRCAYQYMRGDGAPRVRGVRPLRRRRAWAASTSRTPAVEDPR